MPNPVGRPRRIFLEPGQRFGKGIVTDPDLGGRPRMVRLQCDCGTEYTAQLGNVTYGITKSCGCLKMRSDGISHHLLWATWHAMIYRCENPAVRGYPRYGGRGITVCEQWHDFSEFATYIDQVLGPRPPGCTLDREDNDGHYEPGNVRWATHLVQARNRPPRRKLSHEDVITYIVRWRLDKVSISALAREAGVNNSVMNRRIHAVYDKVFPLVASFPTTGP